jgi:hypothetical protein
VSRRRRSISSWYSFKYGLTSDEDYG